VQGSGAAAVRRRCAHRLLPRSLCEQLGGGRLAQVGVGQEKHAALELLQEGRLTWVHGRMGLQAGCIRVLRRARAATSRRIGGLGGLKGAGESQTFGRQQNAAAASLWRPQGEGSRLWPREGSPEQARGASEGSGRRGMGCGEARAL
jgi:hypothetical protein